MSSKTFIPVDVEKTFINASINTALTLVLLHGIYTIVCAGTIYLYLTKKERQKKLIVIAIAALYMVTAAQVGVQWKSTQLTFVDNGETRLSAFIFSLISTPLLEVLGNLLQYMAYIIADGLLIWRCFHVSGKSLLRISLPLILYTAEIMSCIASVIMRTVLYAKPDVDSSRKEQVWNFVNGAESVITALTSIFATSIICFRIYTATSYDMRSRRRYRHILRILIESSMIYSAIIFTVAVIDFLPFATIATVGTKEVAADYMQVLAIMTTGIAPTLMVASIALYSATTDDPSTNVDVTRQLSGLQFHVHNPEETSTANSEMLALERGSNKEDSSSSYSPSS